MNNATNVVGERVRARRKVLRISQAELAEASGLDDSYISLLETGKRPNPGLDTLQRLAHALLTSISYLIGETEDPAPPPDIAAHQTERPGTPMPARVQLAIERAVHNIWREMQDMQNDDDADANNDGVSEGEPEGGR